MADDDIRGDDVIKSPAPNSPKHSKETWREVKLEFESGSYLSLVELAHKYGIEPSTLRSRMVRERWNERQRALQSKVELKTEKALVGQAEKYLEETFLRSQKYLRMVDASQEFNGSKAPDGTPLLDPDALDTYSRTEVRIHELAKSALRIVDQKSLDLTSGGKSMAENLTDAIEKLRGMNLPPLTDEQITQAVELGIEEDEKGV